VRRLRERERGSLAGWLHDGPIQDLAAVPLILAEARRATGTSSDDALDIVAEQVTQAGRMLRGLQDDLWPFPAKAAVGRLAAAVGAGAADVVRHGRRLRVRMDLPRRPQVMTRSAQMSP